MSQPSSSVISFLNPDDLRPHEKTVPQRVNEVLEEAQQVQWNIPPLLVDRCSRTILDGHHRWTAARLTGVTALPCREIDYLNDARILVASWRPGEFVSKQAVVQAGLTGVLFPPKSTRHYWAPHVDTLEPGQFLPLRTQRYTE